jgi:hypothetical protein
LFPIVRGSGATLAAEKELGTNQKRRPSQGFSLQKNPDQIYKEPEDKEQEHL